MIPGAAIVYLFDFDRNLKRYIFDTETRALCEVETSISSSWDPLKLKNYGILKRFLGRDIFTYSFRGERYFGSGSLILKVTMPITSQLRTIGPFHFYSINIEGRKFKFTDVCFVEWIDKFANPLRDRLDVDASDYQGYLKRFSAGVSNGESIN